MLAFIHSALLFRNIPIWLKPALKVRDLFEINLRAGVCVCVCVCVFQMLASLKSVYQVFVMQGEMYVSWRRCTAMGLVVRV